MTKKSLVEARLKSLRPIAEDLDTCEMETVARELVKKGPPGARANVWALGKAKKKAKKAKTKAKKAKR